MPFTYMLRCADDTLYVGFTEDLPSRERTHNNGRGSAYTARRRPVKMVYAEEHDSTEAALARERQLKRWTHEKKEALIRGDRMALDRLSHRSSKPTTTFTWRDLLNRS